MPSVKIPKKSTDTDMTPFVDVAFLILSFFMLATKFKPPEPMKITTPTSVSSAKLKAQDALMIQFDSSGKVYLTVNLEKKNAETDALKLDFIKRVNTEANLGIPNGDLQKFVNNSVIASPLAEIKTMFARPASEWDKTPQKGIPIDTANNELTRWIGASQQTFAGKKMDVMIKGDNNAKYPAFKAIIEALRANEIFKYKLITDPKGVPVGTELYRLRESGKIAPAES